MSDTPNIDELRRLACQLKALLDDPHPGLSTWNECLLKTIHSIGEFAGMKKAEVR